MPGTHSRINKADDFINASNSSKLAPGSAVKSVTPWRFGQRGLPACLSPRHCIIPPLTQPDIIAHYRITGKLGEGGMGAVYRATDTKLNRDVAIKVLPPAFAEDSARMQRFEREAQVLASLNHPNIAAIYGIEA